MRKKIAQKFLIFEDQLRDLRQISKEHNGQFMSAFVRECIDAGIKKEKNKQEIFEYIE